MAVTRYTIKQGETGPIIRPRPEAPALADGVVIDSNWICKTAVNDKNGNVIIAARTITTKTASALYFEDALTPAETLLLSIGTGEDYTLYDQIIEITNTSIFPIFNIEEWYELKVFPGGIPNV